MDDILLKNLTDLIRISLNSNGSEYCFKPETFRGTIFDGSHVRIGRIVTDVYYVHIDGNQVANYNSINNCVRHLYLTIHRDDIEKKFFNS